jgi:hypothetical protein
MPRKPRSDNSSPNLSSTRPGPGDYGQLHAKPAVTAWLKARVKGIRLVPFFIVQIGGKEKMIRKF